MFPISRNKNAFIKVAFRFVAFYKSTRDCVDRYEEASRRPRRPTLVWAEATAHMPASCTPGSNCSWICTIRLLISSQPAPADIEATFATRLSTGNPERLRVASGKVQRHRGDRLCQTTKGGNTWTLACRRLTTPCGTALCHNMKCDTRLRMFGIHDETSPRIVPSDKARSLDASKFSGTTEHVGDGGRLLDGSWRPGVGSLNTSHRLI